MARWAAERARFARRLLIGVRGVDATTERWPSGERPVRDGSGVVAT